MKDYKRLTERNENGEAIINMQGVTNEQEARERIHEVSKLIINKLCVYEDKIESGELCDREEVKKEEEVEQIVKERDEYKHRAEVAEMALQIADELGELCGRKEDYVQQAEKELQEERKGDA